MNQLGKNERQTGLDFREERGAVNREGAI